MMKYEYKDEKKFEATVCYIFAGIIASVLLINLYFWLHHEDADIVKSLLLILATIYSIKWGRQEAQKTSEKRRLHELYRQKGIQADGVVERIIVTPNAKRTKELYSFEVSYYSTIQERQVTFTTPYICFRPNKDDYITCKVYEHEGKQIADSFTGYTNQNRWDILINIFIFAIVSAIIVLIYKIIT